MVEQVITRETLVADALAMVPGADTLFREHGADPKMICREMTRFLRISDAGVECELRDVDGLIDDLNVGLARDASSAS